MGTRGFADNPNKPPRHPLPDCGHPGRLGISEKRSPSSEQGCNQVQA
jgi:hypothetical protein